MVASYKVFKAGAWLKVWVAPSSVWSSVLCRHCDWQGTAAPALRQTPAALSGGLHPGDLPTLLLCPLHHPPQVSPTYCALPLLILTMVSPPSVSVLALLQHLPPDHDTLFLTDPRPLVWPHSVQI